MSILKNKEVTVRKERQCFSCFRKFPVGTKMISWANIYEGDFCSGYTCLTCDKIMSNSKMEGEGFEEGFVHESLDKGETPEQFLEKILKLTDNDK